MFKKIKNILGIEGVKIALVCEPAYPKSASAITGQVRLSSKASNRVDSITIKLIEKYKRGRNEATLINEYLLSSMDIDADLKLVEGNDEVIDFSLPVTRLLSDMDKLENRNFIAKGIVSIAKKVKNVKSYYRVEAIAKVSGVSIDAIASQPIVFE